MKKILLLLIVFLPLLSLKAQDQAIFNHYHLVPILINPSAAGFNEAAEIQLNFKSAWSGFEDAPVTYGFQFNSPIGKTFGIGVGLNGESAAQLTRLRGILNYAFRFQPTENLKIAAGFSTEFKQQTLSNDVAGSNFFDVGDQLIDDALNGEGDFDASVGFYGQYANRKGNSEITYFGLVFNNLISTRLDNIADDADDSFFSNYTFHAGHEFVVRNFGFTVTPSLLVRQVRNAPLQIDFNFVGGFLDDQLLAGLSYRLLDSSDGLMGILLGAKFGGGDYNLGTDNGEFKLFYSFDISFQQFQRYNSGSHELTLVYRFKKRNRQAGNNN